MVNKICVSWGNRNMTVNDVYKMTKEELEKELDKMGSYGILTDYEIYLYELLERRYATLNKTHI